MIDELASRLEQVPLFAALPKLALKRLVEEARTVDHAPDREVAAQGFGALAFRYLLEGSAHVDVSGSSRSARCSLRRCWRSIPMSCISC